jgi:virulence-associated protein VapD
VISQALDNYAATTNKAWAHDRSQTVGASEVGQCARKVFWTKNEGDVQYGVPRDPDYVDGWGARVRGTIMENEFWYPAMLAQFGERLKFAGPDQKTLVSGFISATPDGLITQVLPGELEDLPNGGCVTAECKTADPRTNLTEAKAENIYQTHVQMGLIREQTEWAPTHSVLSYMDASFWNEVKEFVIPFDQQVYNTAKKRAAMIMTATEASELKPEGWIAGGRECNYCPFTRACGIQRRSVPETNVKADPQFAAEIADLALQAKRLEAARDTSDERLREVQQDIRDRLRAHGVKKIPGIVNWSHVKGRQAYNNKAIQEAAIKAGIDIEQFSTVGEATDRLTISVIPAENQAA